MNVDGYDIVLFGDFRRHPRGDVFRNRVIGEIDQFQPVLFAEHCQEFAFFQIAELFQCVDDIEFAAG